MTRRLLLLLLPLLLPLQGCFDETLELALQPDGSGRLHLEIKLGKSLASMHKMTVDMHAMQLKYLEAGEEKPLDPSDELLGERLLDFSGIEAWTNTSVTTNAEGELVLAADGWFSDVAQVHRDFEGVHAGFVFEEEAGQRTFEFRQLPAPQDLENVDAVLDELGVTASMASGMTQTLRVRVPAAPKQATGFTPDAADPQQLDVKYGISKLRGHMQRYAAAARKLWPQVQEGTLSRADALEALTLAINQPRTRVSFPADAPVDAALAAGHAKAKQDWVASRWPETLARVQRKLDMEAVGLDPKYAPSAFPAGLVEEESFTLEFQPNGGATVTFRAAFAADALPEPLHAVNAKSDAAALELAALKWLGDAIQGVGFARWSLVFDERGGAVIEGAGYSGPNEAIVHVYEDEDFEDYRVFALVRRWDPSERTTEVWIEAEAGEGAPPVSVRFAPPQPTADTVGFAAGEDGVLSWTLRADGEQATTGWSVPSGVKGMSSEFQQTHTEVGLKFAKQQLDAALTDLKQLTGDDEDE